MENWSFISLRKSRKLQHLLCFFWFPWPSNRMKMFLSSPNDQKYPHYPLVLKLNVTLAWPLHLVIPCFFKWKFLSDVRRSYLYDIKWNLRSDVDALTHTKQLLNLLCIVYITWIKNRGSYLSAHVLLNLLNELGKRENARLAEHFICFS